MTGNQNKFTETQYVITNKYMYWVHLLNKHKAIS